MSENPSKTRGGLMTAVAILVGLSILIALNMK